MALHYMRERQAHEEAENRGLGVQVPPSAGWQFIQEVVHPKSFSEAMTAYGKHLLTLLAVFRREIPGPHI